MGWLILPGKWPWSAAGLRFHGFRVLCILLWPIIAVTLSRICALLILKKTTLFFNATLDSVVIIKIMVWAVETVLTVPITRLKSANFEILFQNFILIQEMCFPTFRLHWATMQGWNYLVWGWRRCRWLSFDICWGLRVIWESATKYVRLPSAAGARAADIW